MCVENTVCFHCGKECSDDACFVYDQKPFCCKGCQAVYEILANHKLETFYELNSRAGFKPEEQLEHQFDFLDDPKIMSRLVDFSDGGFTVVTFYIPIIHCSSCVWILESLSKIYPFISQSQVNFTAKTLTITYKTAEEKLSNIGKMLTSLGYKPVISLESIDKKKVSINRRLMIQLAVSFFCMGNIMLLAFPDYIGGDAYWLNDRYKNFFAGLMFVLSLPVVFYAAQDYFISAFKGIERDVFNMDVPIVIGIMALFIRSTYEVMTGTGFGYFDSLAGFVFFLLLGKYFQQQTYKHLSFDRDYKSFYPLAITKLKADKEEIIMLSDLEVGDRLLIRNQEIIPADAILIKGNAQIDNSFVTGETRLISKTIGDQIYAGGKQLGEALEIEIIKAVDQSYLTRLWNHQAFKKDMGMQPLADRLSKKFTFIVLILATLAGVFWYVKESERVFEIVTSVLIVACPCALALTTPFALGNIMRLLAKRGLYIKDTTTIDRMAAIEHVVFDKTGTITENEQATLTYQGEPLSDDQKNRIRSLVKHSNHPLSRLLYGSLGKGPVYEVMAFVEELGKGISGELNNDYWKIGSSLFVAGRTSDEVNQTQLLISCNATILGRFIVHNKYRSAVPKVLDEISKTMKISILSGDNDAERATLTQMLPPASQMLFKQSPEDKLAYISNLHQKEKVMMVGDGLNDAGALKRSEVGISVCDNINSFSPSCDAILDGKAFAKLPGFIQSARDGLWIVRIGFIISTVYNIIGLSVAFMGYLSPLIAAILMPLSSISIVVYTTIATNMMVTIRFKT